MFSGGIEMESWFKMGLKHDDFLLSAGLLQMCI